MGVDGMRVLSQHLRIIKLLTQTNVPSQMYFSLLFQEFIFHLCPEADCSPALHWKVLSAAPNDGWNCTMGTKRRLIWQPTMAVRQCCQDKCFHLRHWSLEQSPCTCQWAECMDRWARRIKCVTLCTWIAGEHCPPWLLRITNTVSALGHSGRNLLWDSMAL